jgi:hypothetical protein
LLLAGIVTPQLLSANGVVSVTPALSNNFKTAAKVLTENFDKMKVMTTLRRSISAAGSAPDRRRNQKKGQTGKPSAQKKETFMPHKEWWAVSEAQQTYSRKEFQKQRNNVQIAATK